MPIVTAPALPVTKDQRVELMRMAASSPLRHRQVVQAKALLWAADGVANQEIARRCEVDSDAVRRWRAKFAEKGVEGVGVIAKGRAASPRYHLARLRRSCGSHTRSGLLTARLTGRRGAWPRGSGSARTRSRRSGPITT